jgi:N-acetylmuramoyl-L-alanine amidase
VDASCLIGKRIVIDPGHGGVFRGASGPGGLKEADVNLGVALYLWGLLRDGGADVLLTRSSDIDFVDGSAAKLREDLSARAEIAAAFKPHLFVSVHHNADVARSKDTNQVETYFKMLDEGPSKDVATLIHQRLTERLQIVRGSVVPGNYFVLRNARCAAVLGEPSYITNPWVEQRLRLAEKQLLEAQAYYLGIVEYFSRGLASIAALSPSDTVLAEARPRLSALLSEDCSGVDMSTVTCELDGEPLKAFLQPSTRELVASPQAPLGNGTHKFCFTFRNDLGNSSGKQCASFDTDLPPAALLLEAQPLVIPKDGGVLVTATVADENGNFVRDGTPVRFLSAAGVFSAETVRAVAGIASSVFFSDRTTDAVSVAVTSGGAEDSLLLAPSDVVTTCLSIVDSRNGEPLSDARILEGDSLVSVTSPQGLAVIAGFTEGRVVMRNGYIPTLIPSQTGAVGSPREMPAVTMRPVALGVLHGARLALDVGSAEPRDRGIEPDTAASGYCASAAGELRGLLVGAGADVLMLPADVPDTEKVAAAELFAAQRYIRIEPAPGRRASVLSYPGSSSGMKLAVTLVHWWSKVVRETEPEPSEDAHYILRQTSAPAVILRIPAGRLPERVPARRLAYALYLASLEDMGLGASQMIESSVKATGVLPGEAADMVLDGFIHVPLSEDGSATFFCEEGQHMIAVVSKSKQTAPRFVSVRPASQAGEGTR